ncbi:MAG: DUF1003 domain-containing protein [Coriobacteriia bacterium]|nr:DUF1003 domain-containing protein [Coriobacteriia bacterium]
MQQGHDVPSLEEIRRQRPEVLNANEAVAENLSRLDRVAMWITTRVGTMGFFLIIFTWTALWLGWNTLGPASGRFDPYPGFVLWLFISNMLQIFLMPLLMIGQNLQGRHSEVRAENDYRVNVKAEREVDAILAHLENQNRELEVIRGRLDAMAEAGRPDTGG